MTDILVTGGTGQVGTALRHIATRAGLRLWTPSRAELDLAKPETIATALSMRRWEAIINAGAYTAVDAAETHEAEAFAINATAPGLLAQASARLDIPLLHISTDYVFPGTLDRAYREDDPVGPLSVYGRSKLAGEEAVRAANPRHAIIRTSWVVSPHGSNFLKTMLRLAGERDSIRVVADQRGAPTSATDLAGFLLTVADRLAQDPTSPTGTFHFANAGATNWAGFATEIMRQAQARHRPAARIEPIPTDAYPTAARRPQNSCLDTARATACFGVVPRPWQEAVADIIEALSLEHGV